VRHDADVPVALDWCDAGHCLYPSNRSNRCVCKPDVAGRRVDLTELSKSVRVPRDPADRVGLL
jgi:hypothetical protein